MKRNKVTQAVIDLSGLPENSNQVYVPLFNDESRYLVLYGGAGSGKSIFAKDKVLKRILTEEGHNFLVLRKVAKTLRKSVFSSFVRTISDWGIAQFFKVNKTDMTITYTPNGSMLSFLGMDDSEKIKSIDMPTGIWLEEASEFTLDDFTQLDLRLRGQLKHYKQIILSFNPISAVHWLKKRFFDNTDPEAKVVHTTYLNNRFLDDAYIKVLNSLKETNYTYYKIYALGQWGVLKGVIYENWKKIKKLPDDVEYWRWGQDFGFNNPSAGVLVGISGKNLYLKELVYERELTNAELIKEVEKSHPGIKSIIGYMDSAEPDRIQEFRNAGFKVQPAKKDVKAGIDAVMTYNLFVEEGSQNIINELGLYCWRLDKSEEPLDEPVKSNDHAMDALRYAVFQGVQGTINQIGHSIKGF